MELSIETFTPFISEFTNKETLTPPEASRLLLIITEVLVDNHTNRTLLKFLARFLTQQAYDDIVEERNIEHRCGYICCDRSPKDRATNRHQIYNRKPSMILPNTYLSQYCCKEHYQSSLFYRNQLSNEALFGRKDVLVSPYGEMKYETHVALLEELIQLQKQQAEDRSLIEMIQQLNELKMVDDPDKDGGNLVQLIRDFQIVENENANTELSDFVIEAIDDDDNDDNDDDDTGLFNEKVSKRIEGYTTNMK